MKLSALFGWMLAVLAAAAAPTPAQEGDPAKETVAAFEKSLRELRPHGKEAYRPLRDVRRKYRDASLVISAFRRQIRDAEPAAGVSADALAAALEAFGASADAAVKHGTVAAPHIASARDGLRAQAEAAPADAAAEKARLAADAELLDSLLTTIWVGKAKAALAPFKNQGNYLGMFDEHRNERAELAKAWMAIFRMNGDEDNATRALAAEGVVQFAEGAEKEAYAKDFRAVFEDAGETDDIKSKALFSMARLGDRTEYEKISAPILARIEEEAKKDAPDPNVLLQSHNALATQCQEMLDYEGASKHYAVVILFRIGAAYDKLNADQRAQFSNLWYNVACVLSRSKFIELGTMILEQSYNLGYSNHSWAERDLDLANLRADEKCAALMAAWKKGDKKPGSSPPDGAALQKALQPLLPAWVQKFAPSGESKPTDGKPAEPKGDGAAPAGGGSD